jgi:hypothetical protein
MIYELEGKTTTGHQVLTCGHCSTFVVAVYGGDGASPVVVEFAPQSLSLARLIRPVYLQFSNQTVVGWCAPCWHALGGPQLTQDAKSSTPH